MSRPLPDGYRAPTSRDLGGASGPGSDCGNRLAGLLNAIGDSARELERGAALQPAAEALLGARRALQSTPTALLQGPDANTVQVFLHRTLALRSEPAVLVVADPLPELTVLHLEAQDPAAIRRILLLRSDTAQSVEGAVTHCHLQIALERVGDVDRIVVAATRLLRVQVQVPSDPNGAFAIRVLLPGGLEGRALLESDPAVFWSSRLFSDAALLLILRQQLACSAAATALEALRLRLLLLRQEQTPPPSTPRPQELRRSAPGSPRGADNILRLVSDTIAELIAGVRERARRATTRGAWLWSFQGHALGQIGRGSITRDERRRITRLAVNEEQIRGIEASFLRTFRGMLSKELEAVRTELEALCRTLEQQLELPPRRLAHEFPEDQVFWNDLAGYAVVDVRYRGEIPRRGFMERLAEGRKVVFLLLMVGSLAGSFVGFNLRQSGLIGLVCLALFVGTVAWSYKSWSDEENELIDRETDKLTDTVEAAILKTTADAQREATNSIVAVLEGVRKQLLGRLEAAQERSSRELESRQAGEQRQQQIRQSRSENTLRQLQALEPQLQRHTATLEQLQTELTRGLQQALLKAGTA